MVRILVLEVGIWLESVGLVWLVLLDWWEFWWVCKRERGGGGRCARAKRGGRGVADSVFSWFLVFTLYSSLTVPNESFYTPPLSCVHGLQRRSERAHTLSPGRSFMSRFPFARSALSPSPSASPIRQHLNQTTSSYGLLVILPRRQLHNFTTTSLQQKRDGKNPSGARVFR